MHGQNFGVEFILFVRLFNIFLCLVPGDKSALNPSGIRLGTPALTTRGLKEDDMAVVASFLHKGNGFQINF